MAAVGLVLAVSGLAGCSGDDSSGSPSPSSPSDANSGGGTPTTGVLGNRDLPPNYPATDAPVLPGRVVGVRQGESGGFTRWQVLIATSKTPEDALAQASELLTKAGWSSGTSQGTNETLTRGDGESVALTAAEKGNKTALLYVVTLA